MYQILIALFIFAAITLLLIYGADKELKYLSHINIKKVKLIKLTKGRCFFIYHNRKDNMITKHSFVCMIVYYILNVPGCSMLIIHFITNNNLFFNICVILLFLNLILFITSGMKISLTEEQRKLKFAEQMKYREQKRK